VFGQCAASLVALYFNLKKNHEIRLSFKGFKPSGEIIGRIYSVGVPSILMAAMGSVMTYGVNRILIAFTATAAAVFGVYFKLQSFVFLPIFGLNNGMVSIVAYNLGARKKKRIIQTIRLSIIYAVGIMMIGIAMFQFFPQKLLQLFSATPDMLLIGVPALRIISISYFLAGFCIVCISIFQSLGNGMFSLICSVVRQLVVLLPVAWLLSLTGRLNAIWWAFPIAECVSLALSIGFLKRIYEAKIKSLP
jgi:Na+-driven multidrug efflux pump